MCYFSIAIVAGLLLYFAGDWKPGSKWRLPMSIAGGFWWPIALVFLFARDFFTSLFRPSRSYGSSRDVDVTVRMDGETYRGTVRKD